MYEGPSFLNWRYCDSFLYWIFYTVPFKPSVYLSHLWGSPRFPYEVYVQSSRTLSSASPPPFCRSFSLKGQSSRFPVQQFQSNSSYSRKLLIYAWFRSSQTMSQSHRGAPTWRWWISKHTRVLQKLLLPLVYAYLRPSTRIRLLKCCCQYKWSSTWLMIRCQYAVVNYSW